jgi:peptidoglycan/LPS O-acetylase OafA/YrhL
MIFRDRVGSLRPDIQALRALAVFAVVIYHIWPTRLIGGFMGVDVFFVISGYLMTYSIWKGVQKVGDSENKHLRESVKFMLKFYAGRIRRLAPAASVCLGGVLLATYFIGDFSLQNETGKQVFASAIFMQNLYLADQAVDYLGADAGATSVQHFWSLSVEEQFYMIWPLLLLVCGIVTFAIIKRRGGNRELLPLIVISVFTAVSFAYGYRLTFTNAAKAYFVTPARIWELSLGGIICFLPDLKGRIGRILIPWLGAIMIVYPFIRWGGIDFPGWHALLPTLGTLFVIYGGKETECASFSIANLSRLRPAQFFGDISYSLYLWHWPLIILVPYYIRGNEFEGVRGLNFAIFLLSLLLAYISYKFIETPTRNSVSKSQRPLFADVKTAICGTVLVVCILVPAYIQVVRAIDYSNNYVGKAYERAKDPDDIAFGGRSTMHKNELNYNPYGRVDTDWSQFAQSSFGGLLGSYAIGYQVSQNAIGGVDENIYIVGDINASKNMLVLGDSHSRSWLPALDIFGQEYHYKVVNASTSSNAGGLFIVPDSQDGTYHIGNDINSVERNNDRYNYIKKKYWKTADVVIIAISGDRDFDSIVSDNMLSEMIAATIADLYETSGNKPILLQDYPQFIDYDKENLSPLIRHDVSFEPNFHAMDNLYNKLEKIGAVDNIEYLEIAPLFIDLNNGLAHTQIGGIPVYYDSNHVNTLYSLSTAEYITEQLRSIIK